ncbi:hypothetical protein [Bacillus mycoides]|uniref:Preprotein translocase n=1 Tax=Bacillus mycoides TaxID=1405 RepID=A0A4U3AJ85_BACMY|nr:hypothetical protein [Bacillus mycoides]TKI87722.1 hypothetical protein FC701_00730 [Bacillus mycoides]
MNKGDAILRLLTEIKLELKEVKEQVEIMHIKIEKMEKPNRSKDIDRKKTKTSSSTEEKRDWKYPAKMK